MFSNIVQLQGAVNVCYMQFQIVALWRIRNCQTWRFLHFLWNGVWNLFYFSRSINIPRSLSEFENAEVQLWKTHITDKIRREKCVYLGQNLSNTINLSWYIDIDILYNLKKWTFWILHHSAAFLEGCIFLGVLASLGSMLEGQ